MIGVAFFYQPLLELHGRTAASGQSDVGGHQPETSTRSSSSTTTFRPSSSSCQLCVVGGLVSDLPVLALPGLGLHRSGTPREGEEGRAGLHRGGDSAVPRLGWRSPTGCLPQGIIVMLQFTPDNVGIQNLLHHRQLPDPAPAAHGRVRDRIPGSGLRGRPQPGRHRQSGAQLKKARMGVVFGCVRLRCGRHSRHRPVLDARPGDPDDRSCSWSPRRSVTPTTSAGRRGWPRLRPRTLARDGSPPGRPAINGVTGQPRRRTLTLLVNPSSGRGRARRSCPACVAALGRAFPDADVRSSASAPTTRTPARRRPGPSRTAADGDALLVMGGDGMTSIGLNAAAPRACRSASCPAGTGNDFCRGVGLPTRLDAAVDVISGGPRRATST